MVRLCVPADHDQHVINGRLEAAGCAAEPSLIESPSRACMLAAVATAFRSVLGRARPGTFLRAAAIFGLVDGSMTASGIYARYELNKAVFKLDGLDNPKPWKLWERTKQWTLEDATLFGGATGLLLASSPRLLPGVTGFSRVLGVTIAGCAFGTKTGEWILNLGPLYLRNSVEWQLASERRARYGRLWKDEKARASLSRFARFLLPAYSANPLRTQSTPSRGPSGMSKPGNNVTVGHASHEEQLISQQLISQQALAEQFTVITTTFAKEELAAPDYRDAYRQYHMDPADTDLEALQNHLEHLTNLRALDVKELAYVWQGLAQKEHVLPQLLEGDTEKDLLRRELLLLNGLAFQFYTRIAIITYLQADARKRIGQIRNEDPTSYSTSLPSPETEEYLPDGNWKDDFTPHRSAAFFGKIWQGAKTEVALVEQIVSEVDGFQKRGLTSSFDDEKLESVRNQAKQLKLEELARERLFKEYENQVHKGNAGVGN